jgi:glycosyltransferase involved in cell wall biosynthesis
VARIEGRKNQLNLVRAMQGLPWPLVLAGKPAPNHLNFFEQVKREAGSNVHFPGQIDHALLPALYKAARVHVLVSWMETPGLSSLEAAAMGCDLVVTDRGDTNEYFGDFAHYCEPDSVESIRNAILEAYRKPADTRLREHVLDKFTWQRTAEKTLEGYRLSLGMA